MRSALYFPIWIAIFAAAGCLQPAASSCASGGVCASGLRCGMIGDTQICVAPTCGNGRPDPGEACDDGNNVSGDGCPADCTAPCGDGVLDPGEACDDGNRVDGDGCDHDCTLTGCGNGIATAGEACDDGNAIDGDGCDHDCTATACGNGIVTAGEICDDGNAIDGDGCNRDCTTGVLAQAAYVKPSNRGGFFGYRVAFSADGTTLAVGAYAEASAARGVGADQADQSAPGAGAVYVFVRTGARWTQQAYLKASNADAGDFFGIALALSADGSTLAVAAPFEAGGARGIGGNQADNSLFDAGAVYVFTRSGAAWSQQAYLKASNTWQDDLFGRSVALSGDGSTLAVGAPGEDSAAPGIDGDQRNDSAESSGAVYLFARTGTAWRQTTYVKASNTGASDAFGSSVALSGDGATLVVGAAVEASAATGVDGDQTSNTALGSGAAYVFTRGDSGWSQQAYVKASNHSEGFGSQVALSRDGSTMAVGAPFESSAATGIDGNQSDQSANLAGAVYVFTHAGATWSQQAYVKASNTGASGRFGGDLALSADGSTMVVGAFGEESSATGIGGNQGNNSASGSGAVYAFVRDGTHWTQQAYIKASNTDFGDNFGVGVALSDDASSLAVGAYFESSAATGIGGDQQDNSHGDAGAVYVFRR